MKQLTISQSEGERLIQAVKGLGWAWQTYQREVPDGWYEFKYQPVLRQFMASDMEDQLLSQVRATWFKRIKLPVTVYRELMELATIYEELQDALDHPPYGSQP
ncbi:hypothetical protein I6N95_04325 [Vagococcus sp. BWB3-3]|uniref:Uncharacterized protein n=1 Tax=Vagococcus allomyrinae TaxID=2794353 RepID=A0A940P2G4_9ENTE|nr:hypothetical protein [Vagococcus allomyrinae]MBP1040234.1 hypothetical protein [Vagococcus allomyrinae]